MTFFYTRADTGKSASVKFAQTVSDGQPHRVLFTVDRANRAGVIIDGKKPQYVALEAAVRDCGSRDEAKCIFSLGQRRGKSGGAYKFTGEIRSVGWFPNKVWVDQPTVENVDQSVAASRGDGLDWLISGNHRLPELGGVAPLHNGGFGFNGQSGVAVTASSTLDANGKMSVAMHFVQTEKSKGYLYAKSSASGWLRYWGLHGDTIFANRFSLSLDCLIRHKFAPLDHHPQSNKPFRPLSHQTWPKMAQYFTTSLLLFCSIIIRYSKPGRITLYYLARVRSRHKALHFAVDLADGRPYRLILRVDGSKISLVVDDVRIGPVRNIVWVIAK
jgi:hypothetical protein